VGDAKMADKKHNPGGVGVVEFDTGLYLKAQMSPSQKIR
jgi:hypothetical protein